MTSSITLPHPTHTQTIHTIWYRCSTVQANVQLAAMHLTSVEQKRTTEKINYNVQTRAHSYLLLSPLISAIKAIWSQCVWETDRKLPKCKRMGCRRLGFRVLNYERFTRLGLSWRKGEGRINERWEKAVNGQKRYWREVREGADRARKEEGPDFKADHITSLGANTHTQTHKGHSVPAALQTHSRRDTDLLINTERQTTVLISHTSLQNSSNKESQSHMQNEANEVTNTKAKSYQKNKKEWLQRAQLWLLNHALRRSGARNIAGHTKAQLSQTLHKWEEVRVQCGTGPRVCFKKNCRRIN